MLPDSLLGETLCIQQSRFFMIRRAWFIDIYENFETPETGSSHANFDFSDPADMVCYNLTTGNR